MHFYACCEQYLIHLPASTSNMYVLDAIHLYRHYKYSIDSLSPPIHSTNPSLFYIHFISLRALVTSSPIALQPINLHPSCLISPVRNPLLRTASTAASI